MKRFAAALSKQLSKQQQQIDQPFSSLSDTTNMGDDSPSMIPEDQSSADDDMVIMDNIGTNNSNRTKIQDKYLSSIIEGDVENFVPQRSSSPPVPENHRPMENTQKTNAGQEDTKTNTGEALGSAFKKLKTRKKNLSFSKFSGNVCDFNCGSFC